MFQKDRLLTLCASGNLPVKPSGHGLLFVGSSFLEAGKSKIKVAINSVPGESPFSGL